MLNILIFEAIGGKNGTLTLMMMNAVKSMQLDSHWPVCHFILSLSGKAVYHVSHKNTEDKFKLVCAIQTCLLVCSGNLTHISRMTVLFLVYYNF